MLKIVLVGTVGMILATGVLATERGLLRASAGAVPTRAAPVLVELFQSQGCSSCPPANANLNAIAGDPRVVALSFGVTYWDQLGWKDTFAKPQFTERQWEYSRFNHRGNVATPQVWVNGLKTLVGGNRRELDAAISAATSNGPSLSLRGGTAAVGAGRAPAGGADVWLARYEPKTVEVPIQAGENGGRTLPHRNIVRQLVIIGHWRGTATSFAVPAGPAGLTNAVFLQAGTGGPVLAVARG